jgi:hypothetical protein
MNYETFNREQYNTNNNFNHLDIVINNNRTISDRFDSSKASEIDSSNNERNNEFMDSFIKIYRYNFSEEFMNELYKFSKIHQYDHRKDFKEAWEIWLDENQNIISKEITRLELLGYYGDIIKKMFTSARYYFRKKTTEKKEPTSRCTYIGIQKELLDAMDSHIKSNINQDWYKPSDGFLNFCKNNIDLLQQEVILLMKHSFIDDDDIKKKIKKTYKNRYFMIINKNN